MSGGGASTKVVVTLVRPDGGRGTIKVKRATTVGQLKAKLLSSSPLLHKGCRLALFGVELDDDEATVGSLALVQGDCVHVLPLLDERVPCATTPKTAPVQAEAEAARDGKGGKGDGEEVGAKCDGEGEGVKVDGEEEGAKGDDERHGAMGEVDVPEPLADLMRRFDRVNMAATFLQMQRAPVPTVGVLQAACPDCCVGGLGVAGAHGAPLPSGAVCRAQRAPRRA